MKKDVIFLSVLILFSALLIFTMSNFTEDVKGRPLYQKLGFIPQGKLYRSLLGEFRWSSGEYFTFKATTYYGGKSKNIMSGRLREVEYYNLYRTIVTAILLNPYHEDAYYFAEGAFAWDIAKVRETNALLKYVIKYRNWDFKIPFFLGFNYAYFLKDYGKAALYFKRAAEMTHSSLFTNLAARYFYEGGETELGITFLKYMINNTKDERIKEIYKKRLTALLNIEKIETAMEEFKKRYKHLPKDIGELVKYNILKKIPQDPYGGNFYIDEDGKIRTTSKFTYRDFK
ncbi:MAG: hypothetical protein U9N18_06575 [Campylobacterota bacterium]|nr:hypothetical protein [Campylobacterota bacterium]